MRVTNSMLVRNLISNVNNNLNKMQVMQDQLATGKRVQSASDDPVGASKIIKYRTDASELDQYATNTRDATSWLEATESNMMDTNKLFQRARELTVQAANGSNSVLETSNIAKEMEQIKEQIISNANFSFAGRYIFSGYHTDKKLLKDDGSFNVDITDNDINNTPETSYQIGVGEDIKISTNGINLYGYVPDNSNFITKMPSGTSDGVAASKSKLLSDNEIDLTSDYSTGGFTINIGGTNFTVDTTNLKGTVDTPIVKADFIDALNNSVDGSANKLEDTANIYFNADNKLAIEPKIYGLVAESITSTPAISSTYSGGINVSEAEVSGASISDADIGTDFDNKSFLLTVNDETKKITLGTVSPQDVSTLVSSLNSAITAAGFASGSVVAGVSGGNLTFSTTGTLSDGSVPKIEVRPIKSNKSKLIQDFDELISSLTSNDQTKISSFLDTIDSHVENFLTELADVGARTNRMELVTNRIDENSVSITKLLSDVQDADMSKVIMWLKNSENVYRASLSTGSRVIQPSLIDFIK
ncbi:flagellar hook-associated protein FlgL [Helicovermis profundi]|uniref:Flagellar hook-associated protein 3 n=1 Tax=Helicovermis profundi TaxID=3065157 RepID=A0AAU9EPX7_9FIRM|nr:hypothetical protein HLPR_25400 [Clostridia bacterium S502]